MKKFTVLAVPVLFSTAASQAQKSIRVFVTTAAPDVGGFVDPDAKQRTDSVKDLKGWLARKLSVVDAADSADVIVTVVGRGGEATGSATSTADNLGRVHTNPDVGATVHVVLKAGDFNEEIAGHCPPASLRPWGLAASDAAAQIEKWTKANEAKLLSMRKPS
jgi:hypothetical protein